jgi:DNA-directed RNA polymerase specialized sigma24 family protein
LEQTSGWADLESLDAALTRLAEIQPRAAHVVQMRFFVGLKMEQIAAALDCALPTVERDWRYARAWLRQRLADGRSSQGTDATD